MDDFGPTEATPQVPRRAWWLNTRRRRAEWQVLLATGAATFTGRPRSSFEAAKAGDPVFLYVSKPDHAVLAVATVADTADSSPDAEPQLEVQLAFDVTNGIGWREIAGEPELSGSEPVRQRSSGTLFPLNEREYSALQLLVMERNPELASAFATLDAGSAAPSGKVASELEDPLPTRLREPIVKYAPERIGVLPWVRSLPELQGLTGLSLEMLEETRDLLEDTGQIILTGPPGTGKTWLARGLASLVAGDPARVDVVQFHPSTSYEDFIEGLKPRVDALGGVTYAVSPGLFVKLAEVARYDPEYHYVLVIDEINRAPLARVFGELLYAIEYRGPLGAVQLSLSGGMGEGRERFFVPENLLIIGTMNTADRSLATIDYALRRRFRFVQMEPDPGALDRWLAQHDAAPPQRQAILRLLERTNDRLTELLDSDHRIGHTYFMLDPLASITLDRLWRTAIRPLLTEYFIPPTGELEEFHALFAEAIDSLRAGEIGSD